LGRVRLSGLLSEAPGSETLVLLVHGLGGKPESSYCVNAACAVEQAGFACLRLALRGADRQGEDFYHAGLVEDVTATLRSPDLQRYGRVLLLGYSMGGTVCLGAALDRVDPRIAAVAAVCTPLDLGACQQFVDQPRGWVYRRYLLGNLKEVYRAVAQRRPVPTPVERAERARTIWEWDSLTVVPRWGFASVEDYYRRASFGPRLHRLEIPTLIVAGLRDPMVPVASVQGAVRGDSSALELWWIDAGGHVYFPARLDLGQPGALGLAGQVLGWLELNGR
jgi:predicted alpha/beta-fold hydrolase